MNISLSTLLHCITHLLLTLIAGRETLLPSSCFVPCVNSNSCVRHVCKKVTSLLDSIILLRSWCPAGSSHPDALAHFTAFLKFSCSLQNEKQLVRDMSLMPTLTLGSCSHPWPSGLIENLRELTTSLYHLVCIEPVTLWYFTFYSSLVRLVSVLSKACCVWNHTVTEKWWIVGVTLKIQFLASTSTSLQSSAVTLSRNKTAVSQWRQPLSHRGMQNISFITCLPSFLT